MSTDWSKVFAGFGVAAGIGLLSYGAYYAGVRKGIRTNDIRTGEYKKIKRAGKSHEVIDDPLVQYMMSHNQEDPVLAELRHISVNHTRGIMTTSLETGRLLTLLCKAIGARKVIDIGVFTGCSAYSMALGLQAGGQVVACDISTEYTDIGKPYWNEGGVSDKIDLRIQPALDTLKYLIDNGESESFDLIFIDADKINYPKYFQTGLKLLRPRGVIVVDNALWFGQVIDPSCMDEKTLAICEINRQMCDDERVEFLLVNVADGLGIAVKK